MIDFDTRLAAYIIWGIGSTTVYGFVMDDRYRAYLGKRDRRSQRELMASVALFLTSLAANLAILFTLFGGAGNGMRGFLSAVALGAFFAAGIVMLSDRREKG